MFNDQDEKDLEIIPASMPTSITNFDEPTQVPRIKTSLPPVKTLHVMNEAGHLADKVKEVLSVVHLIKHSVKLKSKAPGHEGEIIEASRVIFVCEDGTAWGTVSNVVSDQIPLIVAMYGNPPWYKPIQLVPQLKRGNSGFNMLIVLPVLPPDEQGNG